MITVLFPSSTNWFYERFAWRLAADLGRFGIPVSLRSSSEIAQGAGEGRAILLVNHAEIKFDCERRGTAGALRRAILAFDRRVLVNMDSLQTRWFEWQLEEGAGLFTDVFDYGMLRQTHEEAIFGIPLHWVEEAFCDEVRRNLPERKGPRPIPWAIIGHETRARAAFAAAATQTLSARGFIYMPRLKPFGGAHGLDQTALAKVLSASDFYIWGSHHHHRYHECFRASDAVAAGAVPVKIDPIHHGEMDLPWVYPSLEAFRRSSAFADPQEGFHAAVARLERAGSLGANFIVALASIGVSRSTRCPAHA